MTETKHIAVVTAAGERRDGRATGPEHPEHPEDSAAGGPAARSPEVVKTTATRCEVRAQGTAAQPIRPRSTVLAVPVTAGATAV
ncbi:hypothetical protein OH779_08800 [Actinacidiphila glaucinigra]|uniref:hypothetical protein n=1 Tax=Actinacidiphila glaucinigra TaxID=235986 RepID=UPI003868AF70